MKLTELAPARLEPVIVSNMVFPGKAEEGSSVVIEAARGSSVARSLPPAYTYSFVGEEGGGRGAGSGSGDIVTGLTNGHSDVRWARITPLVAKIIIKAMTAASLRLLRGCAVCFDCLRDFFFDIASPSPVYTSTGRAGFPLRFDLHL